MPKIDILRCGGRELNPRTSARLDPESSAFDHLATPAQKAAFLSHLYYLTVFAILEKGFIEEQIL